MMQENAGQFRSAVFGGFHRQDVLNYIETLTKEREARAAALEAELAKERAARASAEANAAQANASLEEAEKKQEEASLLQTSLERELAQTKTSLEEKIQALEAARRRLAELEAKAAALEPQAASWQRLKDTAGDIELSAHERAQVTIQAAKAQAAQLRAEGVRCVLELQARCDRLQQDLSSAVTAAETELDGARAAFTRAQTDMEGIQSALSDLVESTGKE